MENETKRPLGSQSTEEHDSERNAAMPDTKRDPVLDSLDKIGKSVDKLSSMYFMMTEYRGKAELVLTKLTEIVGRILLIDEAVHDESIERAILCKKTRALSSKAEKMLGSFGVVAIRPHRGEEFNAEQHLILGEVEPTNECDSPGSICTCERIGYIRNGSVTPAEVIVFKNAVRTKMGNQVSENGGGNTDCSNEINETTEYSDDVHAAEPQINDQSDQNVAEAPTSAFHECRISFLGYLFRYLPIVLFAVFGELILELRFADWHWLQILITIFGLGWALNEVDNSAMGKESTSEGKILCWGRYSGGMILVLPWLNKLGVISSGVVSIFIVTYSLFAIVLNYYEDVHKKHYCYSKWYPYVAILLVVALPLTSGWANSGAPLRKCAQRISSLCGLSINEPVSEKASNAETIISEPNEADGDAASAVVEANANTVNLQGIYVETNETNTIKKEKNR